MGLGSHFLEKSMQQKLAKEPHNYKQNTANACPCELILENGHYCVAVSQKLRMFEKRKKKRKAVPAWTNCLGSWFLRIHPSMQSLPAAPDTSVLMRFPQTGWGCELLLESNTHWGRCQWPISLKGVKNQQTF